MANEKLFNDFVNASAQFYALSDGRILKDEELPDLAKIVRDTRLDIFAELTKKSKDDARNRLRELDENVIFPSFREDIESNKPSGWWESGAKGALQVGNEIAYGVPQKITALGKSYINNTSFAEEENKITQMFTNANPSFKAQAAIMTIGMAMDLIVAKKLPVGLLSKTKIGGAIVASSNDAVSAFRKSAYFDKLLKSTNSLNKAFSNVKIPTNATERYVTKPVESFMKTIVRTGIKGGFINAATGEWGEREDWAQNIAFGSIFGGTLGAAGSIGKGIADIGQAAKRGLNKTLGTSELPVRPEYPGDAKLAKEIESKDTAISDKAAYRKMQQLKSEAKLPDATVSKFQKTLKNISEQFPDMPLDYSIKLLRGGSKALQAAGIQDIEATPEIQDAATRAWQRVEFFRGNEGSPDIQREQVGRAYKVYGNVYNRYTDNTITRSNKAYDTINKAGSTLKSAYNSILNKTVKSKIDADKRPLLVTQMLDALGEEDLRNLQPKDFKAALQNIGMLLGKVPKSTNALQQTTDLGTGKVKRTKVTQSMGEGNIFDEIPNDVSPVVMLQTAKDLLAAKEFSLITPDLTRVNLEPNAENLPSAKNLSGSKLGYTRTGEGKTEAISRDAKIQTKTYGKSQEQLTLSELDNVLQNMKENLGATNNIAVKKIEAKAIEEASKYFDVNDMQVYTTLRQRYGDTVGVINDLSKEVGQFDKTFKESGLRGYKEKIDLAKSAVSEFKGILEEINESSGIEIADKKILANISDEIENVESVKKLGEEHFLSPLIDDNINVENNVLKVAKKISYDDLAEISDKDTAQKLLEIKRRLDVEEPSMPPSGLGTIDTALNIEAQKRTSEQVGGRTVTGAMPFAGHMAYLANQEETMFPAGSIIREKLQEKLANKLNTPIENADINLVKVLSGQDVVPPEPTTRNISKYIDEPLWSFMKRDGLGEDNTGVVYADDSVGAFTKPKPNVPVPDLGYTAEYMGEDPNKKAALEQEMARQLAIQEMLYKLQLSGGK